MFRKGWKEGYPALVKCHDRCAVYRDSEAAEIPKETFIVLISEVMIEINTLTFHQPFALKSG